MCLIVVVACSGILLVHSLCIYSYLLIYLFQVIGGLVDLEQMQDDYERLVTDLLEWIHTKVGELNDRNFSNSLVGIKRDMAKFTDYRVQEKPPKWATVMRYSNILAGDGQINVWSKLRRNVHIVVYY